MGAILALLPGIITLIPQVATGAEKLIALVSAIRTAAKQTNEWSPELETAFLDSLIATNSDPAYQPDPRAIPGAGPGIGAT